MEAKTKYNQNIIEIKESIKLIQERLIKHNREKLIKLD